MESKRASLKWIIIGWIVLWALTAPWHQQYPWLPLLFLTGTYILFIIALVRALLRAMQMQPEAQLGTSEQPQGNTKQSTTTQAHGAPQKKNTLAGLMYAVVALGVLAIVYSQTGPVLELNFYMIAIFALPFILGMVFTSQPQSVATSGQLTQGQRRTSAKRDQWMILLMMTVLTVLYFWIAWANLPAATQ